MLLSGRGDGPGTDVRPGLDVIWHGAYGWGVLADIIMVVSGMTGAGMLVLKKNVWDEMQL